MILKYLAYSIITITVILLLMFVLSYKRGEKKIESIYSHNVKISNLLGKSQNVDLKNFTFLDSIIRGKNVIVLGEQQHGDGSTQALYSDLVLYLFKNGFNSLYLEAPYFKTSVFWENLQNSEVQDFTAQFYPFWSNSSQTKILRDSIIRFSQRETPLYIKGLDFNIPTVFSQQAIYNDLITYMKTVPGFFIRDFKNLKHALTNGFGPVLYFNNKNERMDKNRVLCLAELKRLEQLISKKNDLRRKDSVYVHYLNNIYHFFYAKMYLKGSDYNNYRDSIMYENFIWQEGDRPRNKSIIWTANRHGANEEHDGMSLGAYVKREYRDRALTILTTSYSGVTTNIASSRIQRVNTPTKVTMEHILKENTDSVSFFVVPEKLKKERAPMRFYGYNNIESDWFSKLDAFFFIKNMKPSDY